MDILQIPAYAKVNLFLWVKGKRQDGYHEISTLYQSVALHDKVILKKRDKGIEVEILGASLPSGSQNLVHQAASLLHRERGFPGVKIVLHKRIPIAAGLGGGSSDAGATLLGLNYLFGLGLTPLQLARLGARIGSDVPFCILGGTAWGRGRGEQLDPLPPPPTLWLVLVTPPFSLKAQGVYQRWDEMAIEEKRDLSLQEEGIIKALYSGDRKKILENLHNDLEIPAISLCPEIGELKTLLMSCGAERVLLSGSGPTLMGITPTQEKALRIASRLRRIYKRGRVIVTRTLNLL